MKTDPTQKIPLTHAVGVVDACGGNLTSLTEALWRLEKPFVVSSDPDELRGVERLILPGVGAARETMERLAQAGLVGFLQDWTRPLLGICIGMQILFETSDEGAVLAGPDPLPVPQPVPLLGLIPGRITALKPTPQARVPHMGWNQVRWLSKALRTPCFEGPQEDDIFYFVHSYQAPDGPWVVGVTDHGSQVPAAVQWKNLYGVQFHPEKSQHAGRTLLRNFLNL